MMNRSKKSEILNFSVLFTALLVLSACSTSLEAEEGDSGGEPVAAEGAQPAPTDAVPADSTATAATEGGSEESNIELELAAQAQKDLPASNPADTAVASTEASNSAATPAPDATAQIQAAPAPDLNSAPPAPVAESTEATPAPSVSDAPAPVERSVASAAPVPVSGEGLSYTVKAGDTLMKISWEQYGDLFRWREIYSLNRSKIQDPNHVPPGTVLQIAGTGRSPASAVEHNGTQYQIVQGDTLGKISGKVYGAIEKWKKIWENNKQLIRDPNKIYAGFYLYYVPEAKMTSIQVESSDSDSGES